MRFLLDTNVVAELQRPQGDPGVLRRLHEAEADCALAATTWHELCFGVRRLPAGRRRDALHDWLTIVGRRFTVLAYDRAAADWHAGERSRLSIAGRTPPSADGEIAAVAATRNLTLVTRNAADFASFRGVRLESWWS